VQKTKLFLLLQKNLKKQFCVDVVGYHHGYIFLDGKDFSEEIIDDINKKSVDILLVGLPTELQEHWIKKNIDKLNCKIVIGVGGSFDIISGRLKRAPKLFRILGLEWYFRLLQEPWRIKRILKLPLALTILFFDCLGI
jgi:N-acetylglucosaminyldiphosphoundecaprenol N-acetyl-beta-D-mannosaminyltransferase